MKKRHTHTMYTTQSSTGWWEQRIFDQLLKYLLSKGLEIKAKKVESFVLKYPYFKKKEIEFLHYFAIIQNDHNGIFYVLDCHDWENPFEDLHPRRFLRDRRCKVYLKCQYQEKYYKRYPLTKVKPWTYFESESLKMQAKLEELRTIKRIHKSLYFKGNTDYGRDVILDQLKKRGLVHFDGEIIGFEQYLKESCQHKILLALPGMGNICHREIEGFGTGTPVLMPRLRNTFYNELIPDYHYISVEVDTDEDKAEFIGDKLEERFRQVIDNGEYLDFVAKNAMKWYDENVRFPNSLDLTARLLGFIK